MAEYTIREVSEMFQLPVSTLRHKKKSCAGQPTPKMGGLQAQNFF